MIVVTQYHCWVVLCDKRKTFIVRSFLLLKSRLSLFEFHFWEDFIYQSIWMTSRMKAWSECSNVLFKRFSWRVSSKQPQCFAFDEAFTDPWWVAGREIRSLKCFCRFVVSLHVKDRCISKSIAFVNASIQENGFFVWYFSREFNGWMMSVSLFNEPIYILYAYIPQREHIIDVSFPHQWLSRNHSLFLPPPSWKYKAAPKASWSMAVLGHRDIIFICFYFHLFSIDFTLRLITF